MAVLSLLILTGCGTSSNSGAPPSTKAPTTTTTTTRPTSGVATPEVAIRDYLAARDHSYAGDCSRTSVPADIGKYCSILQEDNGMTRKYLVGPVASEGDIYVVARDESGWRVASVTKTPPLAP
jgi:hypothetical protein